MTETASSGIRILAVDDHPIVLGGIAGVIAVSRTAYAPSAARFTACSSAAIGSTGARSGADPGPCVNSTDRSPPPSGTAGCRYGATRRTSHRSTTLRAR